MSSCSVGAFVAGDLFALNKFHYRPHLNSFVEMRGKIYALYSSRRLSCTSGYWPECFPLPGRAAGDEDNRLSDANIT